jgi:hypothetical protein
MQRFRDSGAHPRFEVTEVQLDSLAKYIQVHSVMILACICGCVDLSIRVPSCYKCRRLNQQVAKKKRDQMLLYKAVRRLAKLEKPAKPSRAGDAA